VEEGRDGGTGPGRHWRRQIEVSTNGRPGLAARRTELAAFLRARRAGLRPTDVGLPDGSASGRRRTPGLRREEVAQLAGVSVTWYTWLEQGRDILASAQVIDALARALLLSPDQHRHFRELAGLAGPVGPGDQPPVDDLLPRLRQLVDAVMPNIASIYDSCFNYLVWNTAYARVRNDPGDLPSDRRNLLWMMFTDVQNRTRMTRWEPAARAVLSQFRAAVGQRPGEARLAEIVAALTEASPEFREWWAEYPVRYFRPATIGIDHPQAGRLALEVHQLRLAEQPDLLMVLQVPASRDDLERVSALLGRT
jgi:transcriptional regulator with XRE-family HTH domain